jgi:hypothetical protein
MRSTLAGGGPPRNETVPNKTLVVVGKTLVFPILLVLGAIGVGNALTKRINENTARALNIERARAVVATTGFTDRIHKKPPKKKRKQKCLQYIHRTK